MKIHFVLTAFSPAMFGTAATTHLKIIPIEEARELVDEHTKIMATRVTHERLAKGQFPKAGGDTTRYAQMTPGCNAIHLHYRGPMIPDSGELPVGGMVTCYLIETEEYQTPS